MTSSTFVVCVRNAGYEASLDCGKRYRLLPDAEAAGHRQVRIIDESGEDYLYPESCFSSANEITICCADIGSIRKGRFGWASLTTEPDARESAVTRHSGVLGLCLREARSRQASRARFRVPVVGADR